MLRTVFIFVLLLGLVSPVRAQTGKITFYRPAGYWARLAKITVFCDGKEVARLSDRTKITVTMTAETHQCYDKKDASRKTQPLVFTLGKEELFIQVSWGGPSSYFDKVRPQLKLQMSGWYPDANDPNWREIRPLK